MLDVIEKLKPISDMPGPEEIKDNGNIEGDLALFQINAHKKYGRYVKFKLDADTVAISTTDVEALKRCAKIFHKPEKLYQFLEPLIGKLMFLPMDENKALRYLTIRQFSPALVQRKFQQLIFQLDDEIKHWIIVSKDSAGIICIQEKTKALAMRLTITLVCGQDFPESDKFGICIHTALEELLKLQYDKNYSQREKLEPALNYIDNAVNQFILKKQQLSTRDQNEKVFLDEVLEKYQDETVIKNIIKEVLMAGYHTVASSVAWTLYAIATHPQVAEKIHQEISSFLPDDKFNYEALSKLKYLNLVIKESSRRYTVGPYTAREADDDLDIGGYHIPKGTILFYPIWAVHMDSEYWPVPEEFNPDRFNSSYNKAAFMPFGFGARICPGMNISQVQILLILARLLQKLSFHEIPNFKPIICENFVLISKNDIQLRITSLIGEQ
jgi:cytochrome P450